MIRQLGKSDARFDFAVQLQTDADAMPIEDPVQEWSEAASPFRKVATIRILKQDFDSDKQRAFGENLSYSPRHSLPEHRPLGGVNRTQNRVCVYFDFPASGKRYAEKRADELGDLKLNHF